MFLPRSDAAVPRGTTPTSSMASQAASSTSSQTAKRREGDQSSAKSAGGDLGITACANYHKFSLGSLAPLLLPSVHRNGCTADIACVVTQEKRNEARRGR